MVKVKDKEIDKKLNESEPLKKLNEDHMRKKLTMSIAKLEKLNRDLNKEISYMNRQMALDGQSIEEQTMKKVLEFMTNYRNQKSKQ